MGHESVLSLMHFICTCVTVYKIFRYNSNDLEAVIHTIYNGVSEHLSWWKVFPVYAIFEAVALKYWDKNIVDKVFVNRTVDDKCVVFKSCEQRRKIMNHMIKSAPRKVPTFVSAHKFCTLRKACSSASARWVDTDMPRHALSACAKY